MRLIEANTSETSFGSSTREVREIEGSRNLYLARPIVRPENKAMKLEDEDVKLYLNNTATEAHAI